MAPILVLTIGYDINGVPSCLYVGLDLSAAQVAATTANAAAMPLVQIHRNPGPAFQEFRPVPTFVRSFDSVPPEVQLPSGLAG
jgi:hypothetical protein